MLPLLGMLLLLQMVDPPRGMPSGGSPVELSAAVDATSFLLIQNPNPYNSILNLHQNPNSNHLQQQQQQPQQSQHQQFDPRWRSLPSTTTTTTAATPTMTASTEYQDACQQYQQKAHLGIMKNTHRGKAIGSRCDLGILNLGIQRNHFHFNILTMCPGLYLSP